MTRGASARDKAARLSKRRHAPVVDPERLDEPEVRPASEVPASSAPVELAPEVVRVRPVKVSLELAPELHADLTRWCLDAARKLGRGRVNSTEPLRVLIRRLLADERLSEEVLTVLRQKG